MVEDRIFAEVDVQRVSGRIDNMVLIFAISTVVISFLMLAGPQIVSALRQFFAP